MDSILTAKGLTKKYSKFTLGELDLEIPKGFATALIGANGAGKTTLVSRIAALLGADDDVTSPTFAIVNQYEGERTIYHFDMYRIESEDDLYSIGFYDYLDNGICLCEWSENIEDAIPSGAYFVTITRIDGENGRKIEKL